MAAQTIGDGQFGVTLDGTRYLQITDRSNVRYMQWPDLCSQLIELRGGAELDHEPTVAEILAAVGDPGSWDEIVFAGPGEPTLRLYELLEAARRIREHGGRVRLETDGLANIYYQRDITPDLEGSLDQITIALHTHDQTSYERYFQSGIGRAHEAVVEFARRARDFVPQVTLVAMDGAGDVDLEACRRIAEDLGARFQPTPYVTATPR